MANNTTKRKTGGSGTGRTSSRSGSGKGKTTRSGSGRSSAGKRQEQNAFFRKEAAIVGLFALALLLFLSNFGLCGAVGSFFRGLQTGLFGVLGYVFPLFLAGVLIYALWSQGSGTAVVKIPAAFLVYLTLAAFIHLFKGGEPTRTAKELYADGAGGGLIGGSLCSLLRSGLGTIGAALVLIVLLILLLVLITERSFVGAVRSGSGKAYRHAREDLGHYREERSRRLEERRQREEERRRYEEEERDRNFNLAATDLSKIPKQPVRTEMPEEEIAGTGSAAQPAEAAAAQPAAVSAQPAAAAVQPAAMTSQLPEEAVSPQPAESFGRQPADTYAPRPAGSPEMPPAEYDRDPLPEGDEYDDIPLGEEYMEELPDPLAGRTPEKPAVEPSGSRIPVIEENSFISAIRTEIPVGRDAASPSSVAEDPYVADAFAKIGAIMDESGMEASVSGEPVRPAAVIPKADPTVLKPLPPVVPVEPAEPFSYDEPAYTEPAVRPADPAVTAWSSEPAQKPAASVPDYSLSDEAEDEISISLPGPAKPEEGVYEPYGFENVPEEEAPEIDLEKVEQGFPASAGQNHAAQEAEDPDARVIVTSTGKVLYGETQRVEQLVEKKRRESDAGEFRAAMQKAQPGSQTLRPAQSQTRPAQSGVQARPAQSGVQTRPVQQVQQHQPQQAAVDLNAPPVKEYHFPPLTLLEKGAPVSDSAGESEFRSIAEKLETTCRSFGVDVTVTSISRGPTVTRYELLPAPGVKVARIVALSDDIKLSLAASDIRIEAPIPGKSAVGIEVPNRENNTVYLRDLFESEQFSQSRAKIAFAVGKDIGGQVVVTDISKMPHMLIAGATGSGKSVCINTLIMSILFRYKPQDVKLIMVDPKVVELSVYNGIPHLLIPVVTDPKKAAGALNWAVAEMTDRYKKFASTGVRDLKGYNERIRKAKQSGTVDPAELPEELPQIVIIIDELADLMMVAQHEVEESICRLAQLARAAGLHLVIATQRPSVNVITGLIKANIPSRIAFAVSSGVDSRTILDGVGAEKLLGKGDMLFAPQGAPRPVRIQGAFVSDSEVQAVVDFIKEEDLPLSYNKETVAKIERSSDSGGGGASGRDELFAQAGRFLIDKKKATIGNLQRMFKIGFNRAARIMDQLYEAGVVGEEQGTKPREIIMTAEQFEELLRNEE